MSRFILIFSVLFQCSVILFLLVNCYITFISHLTIIGSVVVVKACELGIIFSLRQDFVIGPITRFLIIIVVG